MNATLVYATGTTVGRKDCKGQTWWMVGSSMFYRVGNAIDGRGHQQLTYIQITGDIFYEGMKGEK